MGVSPVPLEPEPDVVSSVVLLLVSATVVVASVLLMRCCSPVATVSSVWFVDDMIDRWPTVLIDA